MYSQGGEYEGPIQPWDHCGSISTVVLFDSINTFSTRTLVGVLHPHPRGGDNNWDH